MIGSIFPVRQRGHDIIRGFDWKLAFASLKHLNWGWLLLSIILILATYYGRALRWAIFLKPLKPKPSIANVLSATVIGFSAVTVFGRPGRICPPLSDRNERRSAGGLANCRLDTGAHFRLADGAAGVWLRAEPSGGRRIPWRIQAGVGFRHRRAGPRESVRWLFWSHWYSCATSRSASNNSCSPSCASCRRCGCKN